MPIPERPGPGQPGPGRRPRSGPRSGEAGAAAPGWTAASRQAHGRRGEQLARRELERRGYRVLECNARTRAGEIDLVALDGRTLCFVEVRTRTQRRFGTALESVDGRKQRQLMRAAAALLRARRWPRHDRIRFDVVGVEVVGSAPRVELLRNAFYAQRR